MADGSEKAEPARASGSQTLQRGLDLLDQVIDGPVRLADLSERMGLTRSTTHRLANALVDRGFLTFLPREGYQLGPKLLQLGFLAQSQTDVVQIARPHLEAPCGVQPAGERGELAGAARVSVIARAGHEGGGGGLRGRPGDGASAH